MPAWHGGDAKIEHKGVYGYEGEDIQPRPLCSGAQEAKVVHLACPFHGRWLRMMLASSQEDGVTRKENKKNTKNAGGKEKTSNWWCANVRLR